MRTTDIVIVGAGIIGIASARALAADGLAVTVIDRLGIAEGASGNCQGTLGYPLESNEYDLRLRELALAAYENLAANGFDMGYRCAGELILAEPQEAVALGGAAQWLCAHGHSCEWLDARQVQAEEPDLSSQVPGAFWIPEAAQVTPSKVVATLAGDAKRRGVQFDLGAEVTAFKYEGGRIAAVRAGAEWLGCKGVVVAAGAWSHAIGQQLSLSIPVTPHQGHVVAVGAGSITLNHVISEASFGSAVRAFREQAKLGAADRLGPQLASVLQQTAEGPILIGSSRELVGYDVTVNSERVAAIRERAARIMPGIRELPVLRRYVGLRPSTPDGRPLLGRVDGLDGVILATGHGGDGMTLGPLTGQLVADLVTGRDSPIDLSPMAPDRFYNQKQNVN